MQNLATIIEEEMNSIKTSMNNFPWNDKSCYASWLTQTYRMVCHSTRMVAYASGLTKVDNQSLHHRFLEHAFEEKSHEILCLNDLKALSQVPNNFTELAATKALYQCQYYLISRKDPTSVLGYILFLECLASQFGRDAYEKVKSSHGPKAGQFLRVHSEEDADHVKAALVEVQKLPAEKIEFIIDNLQFSRQQYQAMLSEIVISYNQHLDAAV